MRHMLLAYNKLSFSQVYKLYKSLQHYYHSHYAKPANGQVGLTVLVADDSDMDLTSTEDTVGDRVDKEELDTPLHESELQLVAMLLSTSLSRFELHVVLSRDKFDKQLCGMYRPHVCQKFKLFARLGNGKEFCSDCYCDPDCC